MRDQDRFQEKTYTKTKRKTNKRPNNTQTYRRPRSGSNPDRDQGKDHKKTLAPPTKTKDKTETKPKTKKIKNGVY